ncbi:kinesin motor catalytic domain protein (macronuclear) [Tetrahymena thermophila SB210]|uniref:Kinesin motor catalytic domain protein n=1 Tax=Tetrahymena thermophila (strain SB210) TaxID=312017 RepID=Q22AX4_TETTS|nr:kinesin motor catalytic domain protein [Tetrahymena thermophila SB210]EAR82440.2 kinesin motor catalytic domain protein [Tetrahymena thermophila SB210]|eukprot:XP_001030103.2 kinesin motor catalytic domain protein [Tetrahymena thermophila SB210]
MMVKSPERIQKQYLKTTSSLVSSFQVNGEKRLKSLDSRTSIQNRHLYSYQLYQSKQGNQPITNSQVQGEKDRRYGSEGGHMIESLQIGLREQSAGNNYSKKRQKKNQTMQVFVRVRPLNQKELSGKNGSRKIIQVADDRKFVIINSSESNKSVFSQTVRDDRLFEMNRTFGEECSNDEVFDYVMKEDIKLSLFEGFNCTCFVYGMTGAGKTYTMFGDICNYLTMNSPIKGLIMLSLKEIMESMKEKKQNIEEDYISSKRNDTYNDSNQELSDENRFTPNQQQKQVSFRLKLSYLEIYNEQIHDLLSLDSQNNDNLMVIEDPSRGVFVPELIEQEIISEQQVLECIRLGNTRRQMASTGQNEFSSRSHAIITFTLEQTITNKNQESEQQQGKGEFQSNIQNNKYTVLTSKLCLVDLAGSERAAVTENKGLRLQEGANINKSLLALGNCINILSDTTKKGAFVPYRDSKLTRLLKDSLGGNTQTYMIACVSPAFISLEETLNTLKYAQRASRIQKVVTKNEKTIQGLSSQKSLQYITLIENMKKEIDFLKQQLASTVQANNDNQMPNNSNFTCESQLNQHAQEVGGLYLLKEKSSNQVSSASELFNSNINPPNTFPANMEQNNLINNDIKRSQIIANGIPSLFLQKQDSTTSAVVQQMGGWQDNDSFSSSGKSVRISCTNTSNNGSVILFKRSPSQLNFTKQQQVHQQKVTEEMNQLCGKILKNLEENWEIQQSIQDLNNLKKQNEEVLEEKQQRLKKLKSNLIQWPHESEINQLQIGIGQLQNTMANNQNILENMQQALRRNVENKQELSIQMVQVLQSSSDQLVKTMNQTCQILQIEKNDLENANLDLKQQHLHFQTQFQEKVHQIKSMEEQIKQMQKELQEKDQIIQQNQQVIMHLASNSGSVNSQNIPSNLVSGNQINQSMLQTFVSKQNVGPQNPNSVFNPFSSQPSMTSCPFNQTSFFLTNVTNNGNLQNNFNPFLSQADQNTQNQYKDQVDGINCIENKCSVTQPIKNSSSSSKGNQIPKSDSIKQEPIVNNFMQNQSTIVQKTHANNKNISHSATSAPFYCNSSAIYLTNTSNTTNQKHKEAKRFVSSDANPNNSVSKLQIQMQSSINASFSQSTALRSTSSQNTNNKKFFTEKNGYFDFKNKQNQISSGQSSSASSSLAVTSASSGGIMNLQQSQKTTTLASTLNSKNPTQTTQSSMMTSQGLQRQAPGSPQMRVQSPNQTAKSTNNNNLETSKTQNSNGITNINSSTTALPNNLNQNLMASKNLMASSSQMSTSNNYQNFSSPTQSSARLSTVYKSPSSIAQSIINRKSVLTHREKQAQGVKNNSSGAVGALSSFPNNTSSINQALTITPNQVSSKTNLASNSNNNNQSNSIAKLGLQSTIPSSNNVSQLNSQHNNISLNTNNNNNISSNSNNPQVANKLQDARNEYKEFINIFRKIQKDDEEPSQVQNATMMHSTLDEKLKFLSSNNNYNSNNKPSNEYDLFPNASTVYQSNLNNNEQVTKQVENQLNYRSNQLNESPQQKGDLIDKKVQNILSSGQKKGNNPDISLVDFLQTDEFPEIYASNKNQGSEKRQSLERINGTDKSNSFNNHINNLLSNKKSNEFNKEASPNQAVNEIIQTPFLTISSLHQKPHSLPPQQNISSFYSNTSQKPSHQNTNSQGQSSYLTGHQNHNTPSSSSLSKFTINLASNSSQRRNESITRGIQQQSSQKDSKISTPESSLVTQKVDLYKEKEKSGLNSQFQQQNQGYSSNIYGVQEKSVQDTNQSQTQKGNYNIYQEIRRLDNIVSTNDVNQETLKEIKDLIQRLDSSQFQRFILSQSDQISVERLKRVFEEQNYKSERYNQSAPSHGMVQSQVSLTQQRIKSFGLPQKSLVEKENNIGNQNKYQSLSPNKKVNHLVQDVIDKQKKKRSEEFQRHLMLSNLASNIFNSDSDIDLMQTQVSNQNPAEKIQNQKLSSPTNQNRKISTGITNQNTQSSQNGYSSAGASNNVISINLYQNKNNFDVINGYNSTESITPGQSNTSQLQINPLNQQYSSLNSQNQNGQPQTISLTIPSTYNSKLNSALTSSQAVAQLNSTPIAQLNLTSPQPQQISYVSQTSNINSGGNQQQQNLMNNIYKPNTQYA